jgi:hypothetical protein
MPNGCIVWTGHVSNTGYGKMNFTQAGYKSETLFAHRASYELSKGRIPDGMVIDHLCGNPPCVNPEHLEAVDQRTNTLRSSKTLASSNLAKTHCPKGHAYDEANTYVHVQKSRSCTVRACRACNRDAVARYQAKRRAA